MGGVDNGAHGHRRQQSQSGGSMKGVVRGMGAGGESVLAALGQLGPKGRGAGGAASHGSREESECAAPQPPQPLHSSCSGLTELSLVKNDQEGVVNKQ